MQTRYMERTNSMSRGKRNLEGDDDLPDRKRPALASVIVEALKMDSLQKLCSSLEPVLRRVVSEEVERALAKLGPARVNGRSETYLIIYKIVVLLYRRIRIVSYSYLVSVSVLSSHQCRGGPKVMGSKFNGHVVTSGPESSVKLDVVVLEGDFNNEDDEGWTEEEFESHVVKEREGKRPLLTGDVQVTLKEGVGTLGELTFTDNSSWIRSRKFRMGLKVASVYKKHYPPVLNDEVWRLEKIGKDGSFHKRLNNEGIFTVEEFLRLVVRDSQKLRTILGSGMSNKMWEALIDHAKTCVLTGKFHVYYPDDTRNVGVVFNNIYELSGLISGEQYFSADSLSDNQKVGMKYTFA
ncbi:hypothetical protein HYC85_004729 [Camellia sinensis]|uniref:Uncharacterized protein n=1 Tax=Camellia sinensis TaxID=4442 RepID=A0A7J7HZC8_CAMSI|nr:hypothetical protein HYC85_004729 [Camellia sinensis]